MIIAIDGPSGAGKSTVAKAVAKKLGFSCLDTGAMYRAVAWKALQEGICLTNGQALTEMRKITPLVLDTKKVILFQSEFFAMIKRLPIRFVQRK